MHETIQLDDICISVTRKAIRHMYLSVQPPDGEVTMSIPERTRPEKARAYAASKLKWIRKHREKLRNQPQEVVQQYVDGEHHYLWGRPYPLRVIEQSLKPYVLFNGDTITLCIRPNTNRAKRERIIQAWHKALLDAFIAPLIDKWEPRMGVKVADYSLRHMKTRWGSCSHRSRDIRFNIDLVKKRRELIEYVVVHELAHLLEPSHNHRFKAIMTEFYPDWRGASRELNGGEIGTCK